MNKLVVILVCTGLLSGCSDKAELQTMLKEFQASCKGTISSKIELSTFSDKLTLECADIVVNNPPLTAPGSGS